MQCHQPSLKENTILHLHIPQYTNIVTIYKTFLFNLKINFYLNLNIFMFFF